ncbi:fibulin-7-like, partial [Sardina pilchardus]|uniref:fibulin-7-like n=1 Tax=Sardina pilchardus TaxID=27697 RepID=UPI002E0E847F
QSLRNLRKKLNLLKNNTTKSSVKSGSNRNVTCPLPEPLENGRSLGGVLAVGHEVHFLCSPGYELVGSETRVCHESLSWSGPEPYCKLAGQADSSVTSAVTPAPALSPAPLPDFVRASRCIHLQGSTHCTCEMGYTLTGTDNSICTGGTESTSILINVK